jgi:microcystin-dependent protein
MANFLKSLFIKGVEIDPAGASSDQVLKYNGTKFVPGTASTVGSIDDLSDVVITSATTGQALVYNGTNWINGAGGGSSVTVSDTPPSSPSQGDLWFESDTASTYVYYDSAWVEVGAAATAGDIDSLSDVVITSATTGQVLKYNGTNWVNGADDAGTTIESIDDIDDVVVSSPLQFQGLMYDGTNWVNSNIPNTYLVRNNTGSTLLKGTLVGAVGAEPSGRIDVAPFEVTGGQDSELRAMGIVVSNISNGVNGEVISFGTLTGLDTRGSTASALAVGDETWAAGDILFAHPTVDGKLTNVRPQHDLAVALITVRHASTGQLAIRIIPGNNHLEWMHDVSLTTPATGDALTYNGSVWVNTPGMPSGSITQFAGSTAPSGWLSCDGTTVSRTTYAALFAVVGTTYGAGDGSTTFALPNMKGRVPVGYDSAQTEFDGLGETGGEKTHLLIVSEMPSHTHLQNAHAHSASSGNDSPDHTHNPPSGDFVFTGSGAAWMSTSGAFGPFNSGKPTTGASARHTHGITVNDSTAVNQNTGGDGAHNNLQPYIVLNYIIKA